MSPHIPLRHYDRLWDRLLFGGGCIVRETGPKDASVESLGVPMFQYRYFRVAYMGLMKGVGMMFSKATFTRSTRATSKSLTIHVSWV